MERFRLWQLAMVLCSLSGCSRGLGIVDRRLTDMELVRQSPIIVVGRIQKVHVFWEERKRFGSYDGGPLYWFHVSVWITVESVLKGDLRSGPAEYVFWRPSAPVAGEWNTLSEGAAGSRRVHFLRRHGDQLRAVVDLYRSWIRVTTGRHLAVNQAADLSHTIAGLLLEPGEDFDIQHFDLSSAFADASQLIGEPEAVELATAGDPRIKKQACEMLWDDAKEPSARPLCAP
jgi:hypothetical protein